MVPELGFGLLVKGFGCWVDAVWVLEMQEFWVSDGRRFALGFGGLDGRGIGSVAAGAGAGLNAAV